MITMGFCEYLSDNLVLKLCGTLIGNRPCYAQLIDRLSQLGYQVIIHPPFVPVKRWTATVHYRMKSNSLGECNISRKDENGNVEYLQFDNWKDAADCGILLAGELMQKHLNMDLKIEN